MKTKVSVTVVGVIAILAFAYFVPVIYVPALPPTPISGGLGAHYVAISYKLIGQGAWFWPTHPQGTYEVINTPFGSFG